MIRVAIDIRGTKGEVHGVFQLDSKSAVLSCLWEALSREAWAEDLFPADENPPGIIPGYALVLDGRMVPQWEMETMPVEDGQTLKIVQVVPGG